MNNEAVQSQSLALKKDVVRRVAMANDMDRLQRRMAGLRDFHEIDCPEKFLAAPRRIKLVGNSR